MNNYEHIYFLHQGFCVVHFFVELYKITVKFEVQSDN